jgi:hypothetical protein
VYSAQLLCILEATISNPSDIMTEFRVGFVQCIPLDSSYYSTPRMILEKCHKMRKNISMNHPQPIHNIYWPLQCSKMPLLKCQKFIATVIKVRISLKIFKLTTYCLNAHFKSTFNPNISFQSKPLSTWFPTSTLCAFHVSCSYTCCMLDTVSTTLV